MKNLALLYQVGHHGSHRFRFHLRVGAVLVVEVDVVCPQPPQGAFYRAAYHLRTRVGDDGVSAGRVRIFKRNAEFGRNDNLFAERLEGLSQQFLVVMWTGSGSVRFRSVEKRVIHIHRVGQQLGHLPLVGRRPVSVAHTHAAQAYGGHFQSALSQCSVVHILIFIIPMQITAVVEKPLYKDFGRTYTYFRF